MYYILRRFLAAFISIFLVALLVSSAIFLVPGDPAEVMLGINAKPEALTALRNELGLNLPPLQRFGNWALGVLTGDFGQSIYYNKPVTELIGKRLSVSITLAIGGIIVACLLALPLGILAALNQGKLLDNIISTFSQIGFAIPSFWLGLLFILLFSVKLNWLPITEFVPWSELRPWQTLKSLLLPILTLGLGQAAILTRMTRATILDVLKQDFIRVAKAKGLSKSYITLYHALRNALATIITILSLGFAELLISTIIIEEVFALPGMGRLLLIAIEKRDFTLLQGQIFIYASIVILLNSLADVSYHFLDPRIKYR